MGGDVTVDVHGMVGADIRGRRLVVRGAVKGDLLGEQAILLEEGARVVGDVRAPRVAIAPGALVRGYVETGEGNGEPVRASRSAGATRPAPIAAKPAPAAAPAKLPVSAPKEPTVVAKAPGAGRHAANAPNATAGAAAVADAAGNNAGRHGANHAGGRRPPPPVVPALKKAKGQIAKKKER